MKEALEAMGHSRAIEFEGPAGRLEGILQGGADAPPRRLAVVCHPLPTAGGTMHTKVVHRAARALEETGHLVLRFNFRGVGSSEGRWDGGRGEREDARAAIAWLASRHPALPLTAAGFSFGSWIGLAAGCMEPRTDALIAIAPPVRLFDYTFLERRGRPLLIVHGTDDTIAPIADLEAFAPRLEPPVEIVRIPGGSHLLTGHLDAVGAAIRSFAASLPPAAA